MIGMSSSDVSSLPRTAGPVMARPEGEACPTRAPQTVPYPPESHRHGPEQSRSPGLRREHRPLHPARLGSPGPAPKLSMQSFGDSHTLTQEEIANIEAYVFNLNGVDRGALEHPGMTPERFLLLLTGVLALAGVGIGGLWLRRRRPE